jgi:hypothetical protein
MDKTINDLIREVAEEEGENTNCDACLKSNKTLHKVITCGKQELWCATCKEYELGKEGQ